LVFEALKRAGKEKKQNADSNTAQSRNYYVFKEESIRAKAPPVSGVYGLHRTKHYVLIGESADIRQALLHHEKETGFRFGFYRPIGFTFEVCSAELRAQRAQELIAEYRPVLQRRELFAFTRSWKPRKNQAVSGAAATNATQHEDRSDPIAANQKAKDKRFYFSADQLVVVVLALAVAAVIIGFLGVLTEKKIEPRRIVKVPVNPPLEGLGSEPGVQAKEDLSSDMLTKRHHAQSVGEEPPKAAKTQEKTVKPEITEPKSSFEETARTRAQSTLESGERIASLAAVQKEAQIAQAAQREGPVKTWTVQVKASPDRSSADVWAAMLKTKGYDAFIVAADIKGKTWYRVRVGPFDSRHEAETMRKILDSQEGFSDAFLASNNITDTLLVPKGQ
jgi:DedD protein